MLDWSVHRAAGPDIGEEGTSSIPFIICSRRLFGKHEEKCPFTFIDTDRCVIVLSSISSGCITARGLEAVEDNVKRIANRGGPGTH